MNPKTYKSPETRKEPSQGSVHAFREPILCKGIDCRVKFFPKRRKQVFCSPACRSEYFTVARRIGVILLERSKDDSRFKTLIDELLTMLQNLGDKEERV